LDLVEEARKEILALVELDRLQFNLFDGAAEGANAFIMVDACGGDR
jgi:hypothetical protein